MGTEWIPSRGKALALGSVEDTSKTVDMKSWALGTKEAHMWPSSQWVSGLGFSICGNLNFPNVLELETGQSRCLPSSKAWEPAFLEPKKTSLEIRPTSGKLSLHNWQILPKSLFMTQKTSSDLQDQSSLVFLLCQPRRYETGYDTMDSFFIIDFRRLTVRQYWY